MNPPTIYEFGRFRLDTGQKILTLGGKPVRLNAKTFELLRYLVERSNEVLDKNELIRQVWPDSFVEDANLTVQISHLRKIFSESNGDNIAIETFPKVGYRFNADVRYIAKREPRHLSTHAPDKQIVESKPLQKEFRWLIASGALVVIAVTALFWSARFKAAPTPVLMRIAGTESSSSIALSTDGQYIAHAISKSGKRALAMTNIGSGSSVQLIAPDDSLYWGMKFSRDNSYLYFVRFQDSGFTLERIPVLGGQVTTIMRDFTVGFAISPDGSKISYVRQFPDGSSVMYMANADGTGEQVIARRTAPDKYSNLEITWAPDGKRIANLASSTGNGSKLIAVDIETGNETVLSDKIWAGGDGIAWLPDGNGIVGGLFEDGNSVTQVWLVPLSGAEPRRLTTDLENYGAVDISADGRTILAGQFKDDSSLWVQSPGKPLEAYSVTNEKHHMFKWVRWKGESDLLVASSIGPNRDVWLMDVQDSYQIQITANANANIMPDAPRNATSIYFSSNRAGNGAFNIYRSNVDGQQVSQITFGAGEFQPAISADNKWIYYTAGNPNGEELKRTVWKVPSDGGEPIRLTAQPSFYPVVSPDGVRIAFWLKPAVDQPWQVAISTPDGNVLKLLDIPRSNPIAWTADGKGISFVKDIDGVSNVWTQPINGGPPVQETRFSSEQIINFDWSEKGQLVCSRTNRIRDAFLIRNFR